MIDEEFEKHIPFLIRLKKSIENTSRTGPLPIVDRERIDRKGPRTVLKSSQMKKINQILQLLGEESSNNVQKSKTLDYCGDIQSIIDILSNKKDIDINKIKKIYDNKKQILRLLYELEVELLYGFDINEDGIEPGD